MNPEQQSKRLEVFKLIEKSSALLESTSIEPVGRVYAVRLPDPAPVSCLPQYIGLLLRMLELGIPLEARIRMDQLLVTATIQAVQRQQEGRCQMQGIRLTASLDYPKTVCDIWINPVVQPILFTFTGESHA